MKKVSEPWHLPFILVPTKEFLAHVEFLQNYDSSTMSVCCCGIFNVCTCVATVPRFHSVLKELALSKHILSKKTGFCLQVMIILKD